MNILFNINNQTLLRIDKEPLVSGSQNYVKALFTFSDEWTDCAKTCSFIKGNKTYNQVLDGNNSCYVPVEVLEKSGEFYVALLGTKGSTSTRITTNGVWVTVKQSGFKDGEEPAEIIPALVDAVKDFTSDVSSLTDDVSLPDTFPTSIKTIYKSLAEQLNTALDKIGAKYYLVGDRKVKAEFEYAYSYEPTLSGRNIYNNLSTNFMPINMIKTDTSIPEFVGITAEFKDDSFIIITNSYVSAGSHLGWKIDATPYRGQTLEFGYEESSERGSDRWSLMICNGNWDGGDRQMITDKETNKSLFNDNRQNHAIQYHVADDQDMIWLGYWLWSFKEGETITIKYPYLSSPKYINKLYCNGQLACNLTEVEE